jgi:hypothetical protein
MIAFDEPGELEQAVTLEFPAAATTGTPAFTMLFTALSSVLETDVAPMLIETTLGLLVRPISPATQFKPFVIDITVPEPVSLNDLTATSLTFLATPTVFPPMIPET